MEKREIIQTALNLIYEAVNQRNIPVNKTIETMIQSFMAFVQYKSKMKWEETSKEEMKLMLTCEKEILYLIGSAYIYSQKEYVPPTPQLVPQASPQVVPLFSLRSSQQKPLTEYKTSIFGKPPQSE
ncbi:MAG: hypothetical protein A2W11_11930 [Ignavibacteria bacterium RBG_16_35_7]|nr:MAG: hypothetical protein A2W11_11930 [Ignavibacteria bacterium RBG_16_35_7]